MKEIITYEDLQDFKKELLIELKDLIQNKKVNPEYLRSSQVRELLNISNGKLQEMRINGLKFSKHSGTYFYKLSDVHEFIENHSKQHG